MIIILNL